MRSKHVFLVTVLVLTGSFLAACAGAPQQAGAAMPVRATANSVGSLDATQAPAELQEAPQAGPDDYGTTATGTMPAEMATAAQPGNEVPTPIPAQTEAGRREFVGTIEAINGSQWTIGGQVFTVTNAAELLGTLSVGQLAKVHVIVNADGTLTVAELSLAQPDATTGWDDDGQDPAGHDANDDKGQDAAGTPDDKGGNSNDDDGNDDNGGNGGDDKGGDDKGGGNDDGGGDDNGGGGDH